MKWALILLIACRSSDPPSCPDLGHGETAADCPWARIARDLAPSRNLEGVMRREAPDVVAQLERDAKAPAVLALWGAALNYNQQPDGTYSQEPIVARPISEELATLSGVASPTDKLVHAGIQHTYGYLFSTLQTPYGFKRARWVQPTLNDGLGLPAGTIAPVPVAGTLLGNVTWLAGSIAFAGESELAIARGNPELVSPAVQALDVAALKVKRLTETVVLGDRTIVLRTDFVELPHPSEAASTLLVYSIRDTDTSRLVTVFPITAASRDKYEGVPLGEQIPITTQYNAWVDGFTGSPVTGSRTLR